MKNIKAIFRKVTSLELIKTSFFAGIASLIKVITGFVVNKIIAVYLGPSGMAIMSQYQNFIAIANSLATGGIASGVVKYTAEYSEDKNKLSPFLSSAVRFTLITSLTIGVSIVVFNKLIGRKIFYSDQYNYLLVLFGFTIVFFALETLLISVINGFNEIKKYTTVKVTGSIIGLIFTGGLSFFYGLKGALIALTVNQAILLIFTVVLVLKTHWFKISNFTNRIEKEHIKNLLKFTLMSLLFAVLTPIVQIAIRDYITQNSDLANAGYWDGINKLSLAYLSLITTTISVYFLPKYSKLKDKYLIKKEIFRGYKIILPTLLIGFIIIYLLRFFIIDKLYSEEFHPMSELFLPKLLADFLQMASWLVSYLMLAKAMVKLMFITQITFAILNYALSVILFKHFGVIGVVWGTVLRYFIYSCVMFFLFRDIFLYKKQEEIE